MFYNVADDDPAGHRRGARAGPRGGAAPWREVASHGPRVASRDRGTLDPPHRPDVPGRHAWAASVCSSRPSSCRAPSSPSPGVRPYSRPRARGARHLHPRGLQRLPQPAGAPVQDRDRPLRPLLHGRRGHLRPSLPVGLPAHRSGPRPGREEVPRLLALAPPARTPGTSSRARTCRSFEFLLDTPLDTSLTSARMRTLARLGHPYSETEIENGARDALAAGRDGRRLAAEGRHRAHGRAGAQRGRSR